jgi:peptidyl-dipeptidase A
MSRCNLRRARLASAAALLVSLPAGIASAETADEFVARMNSELADRAFEVNAAGWTQATYITVDTEYLNAKAYERYLEAFSRLVGEAKKLEGQRMSPASKRALDLLKLGVPAPAPDDPAKRAELAGLLSGMGAKYGSAKYCPQGKESCRDETQLKAVLESSRNYDELLDAWQGWHSTARAQRDDFARYVTLANEGARSLGYKDLGAMWRSGYDMPADDFEKEAARLWGQVQPFYQQLHCYARSRLAKKYGEDKVPAGKPIPAHLLGNMWAQQWDAVFDLLEPYPGVNDLDVGAALVKQDYGALRMTKSAEAFYQSIGFPTLPGTFWERSMLTQPRDRDVVCHASAWEMDGKDDVRIKMCIRPTLEELRTIYHELGHVYYYLWYKDLPYLFKQGAHDGFHEAIGDTVTLSMTPDYLAKIGLVPPAKRSPDQRADADGAAEDRLPALRQGDRRVALEGLLRGGDARQLQRGMVGAAREVPGCRAADRAHRGRFRSGRQVPRAGQRALHALLPFVHPAVPVPEGAVRRGRVQGTARGMLHLRQRGGGTEVRRHARQGREPAVAGHDVRADRQP